MALHRACLLLTVSYGFTSCRASVAGSTVSFAASAETSSKLPTSTFPFGLRSRMDEPSFRTRGTGGCHIGNYINVIIFIFVSDKHVL